MVRFINILPEINFMVYIFIGVFLAIIFYYIMQKEFFAKIYGAIIIGIIGAIIGGNILQPFVIVVSQYFQETFKIDLLSTFLGTITLLWLFKLVSIGIKKK